MGGNPKGGDGERRWRARPTVSCPMSSPVIPNSPPPPTPPDGDLYPRGRWVLAGWLLVVPVVLILALRTRNPGSTVLIGLIGLTPMVIVPLALAWLAAWRGRSPSLFTVVALTSASYAIVINPVAAVVGCGAEAGQGPEAVIHTHNVLAGSSGGEPAGVAASIVAADPDVVVLQEVRWAFLVELRLLPELDHLAHRSEETVNFDSGTIIWSRWPLSDLTVNEFGERDLLSAVVDHPERPFTIYNVHTQAPIPPSNVAVWNRQFDQLGAVERSAPTVLAGDFNATADHAVFRGLLDRGWQDAHDRKGCGYDATWPVGVGLPVPLLQLDHVLSTSHFEVREVSIGDAGGSDHRPVTVRLGIESQPRLQSTIQD
jgi:endonuclease/exonuclease/phosphatase family metal-dependent hydrolase